MGGMVARDILACPRLVNASPIQILVREGFSELSKLLAATPGLKLQSTKGLTDSEIARLLSQIDFFVSSEFKSAWQGQRHRSSLRVVHSTGAGTDGIDMASLPAGCAV